MNHLTKKKAKLDKNISKKKKIGQRCDHLDHFQDHKQSFLP